MTLFAALSWLCAALGTSALVWVFFRRRYLFVKPSMVLLAAANVLFQWPMAIWAGYIESYLPDPFAALILVSAFELFGLALAASSWRRASAETWERITAPQWRSDPRGAPIFLLAALSAAVVGWYFTVNPLTSTGLFLTLTAPDLASSAREASLKELANVPLRYSFATFLASFGPLLGVLIVLEMWARISRRHWLRSVAMLVLLVVVLLMMSITGARSFSATLLLACAVALYFRAGMPFRPFRTAALLIALITPAAVLTILREGHTVTPGLLAHYIALVLFDRVLVGPEETALWYVHYAQTIHPFGVAAIPKLAVMLGVQDVNAPNMIGLMYAPYVADYVNANASFVFTFYSYFGTWGLILTLVCFVIFDAFVVGFRWVRGSMLLPCVAVTAVAGLALLSADFHTALISNGLLTTPLTAMLLGKLGRRTGRGTAVPRRVM